MKKIKLTQGQVALVDNEDFERVNQFRWCADKSYNTFYAIRVQNNAKIYMHRFIMNTPEGLECDHVFGNGLNNQKYNLRDCTHRQNLSNRKINKNICSSIFKGIYFNKKRQVYQAYIMTTEKHLYLGYSVIEKDAAILYDNAAIKYFGEFARLNFPEPDVDWKKLKDQIK